MYKTYTERDYEGEEHLVIPDGYNTKVLSEQQEVLRDMIKNITNTDVIILDHFLDVASKKTSISREYIQKNVEDGHFKEIAELVHYKNGCKVFLLPRDFDEHSFQQAMLNMRQLIFN